MNNVIKMKLSRFQGIFTFRANFIIYCLIIGSQLNLCCSNSLSRSFEKPSYSLNIFKKIYKKISLQLNPNECTNILPINAEEFYPKDPPCKNHALCDMNSQPQLEYIEDNDCKDFKLCVTAVVKTSGERDLKLYDLITSSWKYYPYLKFIVVADDVVLERPHQKLEVLINTTDQIQYYRLNETVGLAKGRMIGLYYVTTPYFVLLDDDFYFTESTDLFYLFEVLTHTNAAIVAGNTDLCNFFGVFRFNLSSRAILEHHEKRIHDVLEKYTTCYHVDMVKNFFMGKKKVIWDVGGWTDYLMIAEHHDIYIKLKLSRYPIVVCPKVYVEHHQVNDRIRLQRKHSTHYFFSLLLKKWCLDSIDFYQSE